MSSYPGTEAEHSVAHAPRPADGLPRRPALGVVSGRAMTTATQRAAATRRSAGGGSSSCSTPASRIEPRSSTMDRRASRPDRHPVRRHPDPAVAPPAPRGGSTRGSKPRSPPATIRCWRRCASPGCPAGATAAARRASPDPADLRRSARSRRAAPGVDRRAGSRSATASSPASRRRVSELRARWRRAGGADVGETTGLAEFVARQAALALERAERRLRGARYKVPRFVHEDILARPAFRGGIARLARELGTPAGERAARGGALPARDRRHPQPVRHRPRRAA